MRWVRKHGGEDNEQFQPNDGVLFQKVHCILVYKEELLSALFHEFERNISIQYIHHHYLSKKF